METKFLYKGSFILIVTCLHALKIAAGEVGLSILPLPIIFDKTPVNVTVIAGSTAVLPCTVETRGEQQIIWMSPQKVLISTEDRRVIDDMRMSIERPFVRDWNLHIRFVELKDNGIYTCQVTTNPIQIKRIHLNILDVKARMNNLPVPATIIDATSSHDLKVREWETVKLTCNASGVPEPSISWYRHTDQQAKEQVGEFGEILLIHNISRNCSGVYECVADNGIGDPAVNEFQLDVEFAPEVTLRTTRIGHYRGKETILECLVTASPQAHCLWRKGDTPVPILNSWRFRMEVYDERDYTMSLQLRIINLEEGDFGLYTCEASNRLGRHSRDMILYEYHDPTTRRPSTKAPTPYGVETVKLTPRYIAVDDDLLYIDNNGHMQSTSIYNLLRPGDYKKQQGAFNTGYVGAGGRFVNSCSLSTLGSLLLLTSMTTYLLLDS